MVVAFAVGALFYAVLFKSSMDEFTKAFGSIAIAEPNFGIIISTEAIQAFMMALLLEKLSINSWMSGLKVGLLVGLALMCWFDLWMFGSFSCMTTSMFMTDICLNVPIFTIMTVSMAAVRMRLK